MVSTEQTRHGSCDSVAYRRTDDPAVDGVRDRDNGGGIKLWTAVLRLSAPGPGVAQVIPYIQRGQKSVFPLQSTVAALVQGVLYSTTYGIPWIMAWGTRNGVQHVHCTKCQCF
jgi:hypothetical protein